MKNKLQKLLFLFALLLLPKLVIALPAQAGEPDWSSGHPDPNMIVCVNQYNEVKEIPSDAFIVVSQERITYDPDVEVDHKKVEKECEEEQKNVSDKDERLHLDYIHKTRIDGYVFEFHPNPGAPGGWMAVRSRDVPVVARGKGFETEWGSEKDGQYFFNDLGAGPITLSLRLPPDAHPINPNITVMSRGFTEDWNVDLAFYRGDIPPPENIDELRLTPDNPRSKLLPADTLIEIDQDTGLITYMPNVGGVPPLNLSISTIVLAAGVLIILPSAGFITLRRKRDKH